MSNRISPHMSDEGYEMEYIQEAFDTNWIAPRDEVKFVIHADNEELYERI